jgi:hypothetical protein
MSRKEPAHTQENVDMSQVSGHVDMPKWACLRPKASEDEQHMQLSLRGCLWHSPKQRIPIEIILGGQRLHNLLKSSCVALPTWRNLVQTCRAAATDLQVCVDSIFHPARHLQPP